MSADARDTPGMEQFEWLVGSEALGRGFDRLGPRMKLLLRFAWGLTRWSSAAKLATVAELHGVPARCRESVAQRIRDLFNPEPATRFAEHYVSLGDLESTRFMQTFERIRQQVAPTPHGQTLLLRPPAPVEHVSPAPRNESESIRAAAVSYFGRRRPFKLEEVAEFFEVSVATVQRWRRDLQLRCFVRGGVTRISVEEVYKLVISSTV